MVEQIAKGYKSMNLFDQLPNKKPINKKHPIHDVWPEMGDNCEMNLFYRYFVSSEGWLGRGYLAIWSREEIFEYKNLINETYSKKFHFFASDGGGTQFAFVKINESIQYISAPDIGSGDEMRILGNWKQFLKAIREGDYI